MLRKVLGAVAMLTVFSPLSSRAEPTCPNSIYEAARGAYPSSRVSACKEEREEGRVQYEVKLIHGNEGAIELDVSPEGVVLQTETVVAVGQVPSEITKAFNLKYPNTRVTRAERQTKRDGAVTYELAFAVHGKKHEATFKQDGTLLEEE